MIRAIFLWAGALVVLPALGAEAEGTVQYARTAALSVPVSGVVAEIKTEPGAAVKQGDLLLALDDTPFRAALSEAEAAVARAAADRTEAERDFKQAEELYERKVLSTVELENAKLKRDRAGASHKAARARLLNAQYQLNRSRITAPFAGRVLEVRVQPGETVVHALEAKPLLLLAAEGEYLLRVRTPPGVADSATVLVGGQRYDARVVSVASSTGTDTAVRFKAPATAVRVGQSARVVWP
ncbi:MAG: efflux RND transporter periplasmic adaptor subunit [Gammaproteobacteria bacterium]